MGMFDKMKKNREEEKEQWKSMSKKEKITRIAIVGVLLLVVAMCNMTGDDKKNTANDTTKQAPVKAANDTTKQAPVKAANDTTKQAPVKKDSGFVKITKNNCSNVNRIDNELIELFARTFETSVSSIEFIGTELGYGSCHIKLSYPRGICSTPVFWGWGNDKNIKALPVALIDFDTGFVTPIRGLRCQ